ncbi:hypothetical protein GEMRC1_004668 [Eukaryota sp. GEM-RC1]
MTTNGDQLFQDAEKRLKRFLSFGTAKYEDAGDLFVRAANAYKLRKQWRQAGDSFRRAAECAEKVEGQEFEIGNQLGHAANCYKKVDPQLAVSCFREASETFAAAGRFQTAAKHLKDAAESMKSDGEKEAAAELFLEAASLFESEDQNSSAQQCELSAADLLADIDKFTDAAEIYQRIGLGVLEDRLRKFSAREYFLKCIMCHLANSDYVAADLALEKFNSSDASFSSTREFELANGIVEACQSGDEDKFTASVYEYDTISKLDDWKTGICLKIKQHLEDDDVI